MIKQYEVEHDEGVDEPGSNSSRPLPAELDLELRDETPLSGISPYSTLNIIEFVTLLKIYSTFSPVYADPSEKKQSNRVINF